jgi:hypothetical protein
MGITYIYICKSNNIRVFLMSVSIDKCMFTFYFYTSLYEFVDSEKLTSNQKFFLKLIFLNFFFDYVNDFH